MGLPMLKTEPGVVVEERERLARLEEKTGNIETNLNRVEGKVDALDKKLQQKASSLADKINALDRKLEDKISHLDQKLDRKVDELNKKIDSVKDSVTTLTLLVEKSLGAQRVWFLLICAGLLAVMARAFKWI